MKRYIMYIVYLFIDVILKSAFAMLLALIIWLPLCLIFGVGIMWWLSIGLLLTPFILGWLDGCDIFGLKRYLGIDDD